MSNPNAYSGIYMYTFEFVRGTRFWKYEIILPVRITIYISRLLAVNGPILLTQFTKLISWNSTLGWDELLVTFGHPRLLIYDQLWIKRQNKALPVAAVVTAALTAIPTTEMYEQRGERERDGVRKKYNETRTLAPVAHWLLDET